MITETSEATKKTLKVKWISSPSCGDIRTWKKKTKSVKGRQGCDRGTDQEEEKIPKVSSFDVNLMVTFLNKKS